MVNKEDKRVFKVFGKNLRNIRNSKQIMLEELSSRTKIRIEYLKK